MPAPAQSRLLDRVSVLKYATVDKAPTHRAVVQVFFEAKQRYQIELRPTEVLEALQASPLQHGVETVDDLEASLDQLEHWKNLARSHDSAAATTLADYNRRRYLYRLTAAGEEAHRAVQAVEATVGRSGSLQSEMLRRISAALQVLAVQATAPTPNGPEVVRQLHDLQAAFDSLTREATCFMSQLTRHLDDQRVDEERYQLHKQAVLDYISTFVDRLRLVADEIGCALGAISGASFDAPSDGRPQQDRGGMARLLAAAVPHAELPPELEGEDPRARWIAEQTERWRGLTRWFSGAGGEEPTVARLERAAVEAVLRLTRALGRLNDRRAGTRDRAADFLELARRFTACIDDEAAHTQWQAVFGLHAARHFHLVEDDEELASPGTSWWDAAPVPVPVRLRTAGRTSNAGRPSQAQDFREARAWIARMRQREQAQRDAARQRFLDRGPVVLSQLGSLDRGELELLLELLDQTLGTPRREEGHHRGYSLDGQLAITLIPPTEEQAEAAIQTPFGRLRARDWTLRVEIAGRAGVRREGRAWRQTDAHRQEHAIGSGGVKR